MKPYIFYFIILLTLLTACTKNDFEKEAINRLLYAERNLYYDEYDSAVIDTLSKYKIFGERERYIFDLVKNRYLPLKDLDSLQLEKLAYYFEQSGDSLYCAISNARLGDYIFHINNDRFSAMRYLTLAEIYCPNEPYTKAHILYSKSTLYYSSCSLHKIKLLNDALNIYKQDFNYKYMTYCFADLMVVHDKIDSVIFYAKEIQNAQTKYKADSFQIAYYQLKLAEKLLYTLPGDSLIKLASSAFSIQPDAHSALILATAYISLGDTIQAERYIEIVKQNHEKSAANYHTLQSLKAQITHDYKRLANENYKISMIAYNILYNLYSENLNLFETATRNEYNIRQKEKLQHQSNNTISALIIIALLILFLSSVVYIILILRSKKKAKEHADAIKTIEDLGNDYSEFKTIATTIFSKEFLSLKYSASTEENIISKIDFLTNGFASKIAEKYPSLKRKDIIILFMRYIGCNNYEIAAFFGYSGIGTIHHRTYYIKKTIAPDATSDQWISDIVKELTPEFAYAQEQKQTKL